MKVFIQTYSLIALIIMTSALFGQSKDCGNPVYNRTPTPVVKCYIKPIKTIGDTIVSYIPINCNQILYDSTANGHWKIFSSDTTTLIEIVDFRNGLRHGKSIYYYNNRQIKARHNYVNGKLFGEEILYSETGKITEQGFYDSNGSFKGIVTQYWDNGNIASQGTWESASYVNKLKYWDSNGKVISEKKFNKLWYICK